MNRLLTAAVLAVFLHGIVFTLGGYLEPEKTGRDVPASKRIAVSLEHYSRQDMQDKTRKEVSEYELAAPEDPEPREALLNQVKPDKLEKHLSQPATESEPEREQEKTEPEPVPEKAPALDEQLQVRKESSAQDGPDPAAEGQAKTEHEQDVRPDKDLHLGPGKKEGLAGTAQDMSRFVKEAHPEEELFEDDQKQELEEARPLYRDNPPPEYPRRAMIRNQQGTVMLEVVVNELGRVEEIEVAESSGYSILDRAAQEAVQEWVFEPGRRGGRAVKSRVRLPVRFELQ